MYPYNSISREMSSSSHGAARISTPSGVRRVERMDRMPAPNTATPGRYSMSSYASGSERRHSFVSEQNVQYKGQQSKPATTDRIISIRPLQMPNSHFSNDHSSPDDVQRHIFVSSSITPFNMEPQHRTQYAEISTVRSSVCREIDMNSKELDGGRKSLALSHLNETVDVKTSSQIKGNSERSQNSHQKIEFSNVKLIRALGKGSFGEVMLGEWLGTAVAVKRYLEDPKSALGALEEFKAELEALSCLIHPKVVRFLGACSTPPCVFMEFYQRGSLDDHLHNVRTQFTARQCFSILLDISLGMIYVHSAGVLHRDLKPQNILLDSGFSAKVSDFGLAVVGVKNEFQAYGMAGTIPYMAPEILMKQPYGFPVDCYSFGVFMNELLGVQRPYEGMSAEYVMKEVQNGGLRPKLAPCVPAILELTTSCWSDHSSLRPSFVKISESLKTLLESAEKLHNVLNSLVGSVSKLLTAAESTILSDADEARKNLTCLRDMMDPGNDCYDFVEVQGAFLISEGCRRINHLLNPGKVFPCTNGISSGTDHDYAQTLACEVLANACNSNTRCQNQLCDLGGVRSLVNIIAVSKSFSHLYGALICLRKACEGHPGNKLQTAEAGGGQVLIHWIHRCLPKDDSSMDDVAGIPGLQASESFSPRNCRPQSEAIQPGLSTHCSFSTNESKVIVEFAVSCLFAILSPKAAVQISTAETCGISTLIRCLTGQTSRKTQESAVGSLWLALEGDERNIELFHKADGTKEFLNLIECGSPELKKWATAGLHAACSNSKIQRDVADLHGVSKIAPLLRAECLPTSQYASKTLCRAFAEDDNVDIASKSGFFGLIVEILRSGDQLRRTSVVTCLSIYCSHRIALEELCRTNSLSLLMDLLKANGSDSEEIVFNNMVHACISSVACQDALIDGGGLKIIAPLCLQENMNCVKLFLELLLAVHNRKRIMDTEEYIAFIPMLTSLLAIDKFSACPNSEEVCSSTIQLLWAAMENNKESRLAVNAEEGIVKLVTLLKCGPGKCKKHVCAALRTACIDCPSNRQQLCDADGIAELLKFLVSQLTVPPSTPDKDKSVDDHWKSVEHAIAALNNGCCKCEKNCDAAHLNDAFSTFLKILVPASPNKVKEIMALAVVNLCSNSTVHLSARWVPAMQIALRGYRDDPSTSQSGSKYAAAALAILEGLPAIDDVAFVQPTRVIDVLT